MIIQNGSRVNQNVQTGGRVSDDPSRVAAAGSTVEPRPGAAIDLPQVTTKPVARQQASSEELKTAVDGINRVMRQSSRNLEFRLDADTNLVVVKLMDTETGEVIRQMPSEETLAIARSIGEFQQGLLLKQRA